jgi:RHS repeat-associated protein
LLNSQGPSADENPFRFSSEYFDDESGLVYYNFRYYSPELGKWMSRDPIEEEGFSTSFYKRSMILVEYEKEVECVYSYVRHSPISKIDLLGLTLCCECEEYKLPTVGSQVGANVSMGNNRDKVCKSHGQQVFYSVTVPCIQTGLGRLCGVDCDSLQCTYRLHFVCVLTRPTSRRGVILPFKLMWVYTHAERLKDCH